MLNEIKQNKPKIMEAQKELEASTTAELGDNLNTFFDIQEQELSIKPKER